MKNFVLFTQAASSKKVKYARTLNLRLSFSDTFSLRKHITKMSNFTCIISLHSYSIKQKYSITIITVEIIHFTAIRFVGNYITRAIQLLLCM